jgi:glycosyltransferase involved in cell wall biosynthesis
MCLIIAGRQDPRYDSARVLSARLGLGEHVRFLPDVSDADLPVLLGGAECFVFPSRYEGFGLPPLEAMACGTAVVVSNRSSLPEVVDDAGLLVDPEPQPLADGIQRLLADPALRQELRGRGLERAARFSWATTATATLGVYQQAAT